jgi:hypothetical protein
MVRIWLVVCLLGAGSSALLAADCGGLKNLKLEATSITLAEPVTSGTLEVARNEAMRGLPAFCRVAGVLSPTSDSEIRFEVWMPEQGWNGRYLGIGNGGFAGAIGYAGFVGYLKRGFAVAGSDTGHQAEGTDATWAYGHEEKVKDFGWRAVHLTAERAKQILQAYYGKAEEKAYFDSCSDGGREALMEAQRFPEDYDGILAGAPANAWTTMLAAGVGAMQSLASDPRAYISDLKLPAIQKAALDACDALDGVKDGVIGDPMQCHFDPGVLLCKGKEGLDCLTQPQVETLKSLYGGAKDGKGQTIFPGFSMGDETSWKEWVVGEDPAASTFSRFVQNYFRYVVTGDPKWNALTANMDEALRMSREKGASDLDATDPDLSRLAAHGGKVILYHGWNDPAISREYDCLLQERGRQDGRAKGGVVYAALHGARDGALRRRPGSKLVWPVGDGNGDGTEAWALRLAAGLGGEGFAGRRRGGHEVRTGRERDEEDGDDAAALRLSKRSEIQRFGGFEQRSKLCLRQTVTNFLAHLLEPGRG